MANGTLKVQNIETSSGSGTITLGQSGETLALGATTNNLLTPALEVALSANQSLTDDAVTKIEYDQVEFDTDNIYDESTNYRITIPSGKAGKYFVYHTGFIGAASEVIEEAAIFIFKNGSRICRLNMRADNEEFNSVTVTENRILSLVAGDYLEFYVQCNTSSGSPSMLGVNATHGIQSKIGMYRLI